ncbi:cytochrome c oxidase subunit II, partial [Ramlibacter sp.]|uniref:cytochrome c oxidase subunit II n=1 Tax=Ramlibacter sp. TaxID=1917967 RepID=UPI002B886E64
LPDAAHRVLDAMGVQAGHIVDLWRLFLFTCTAVFVAILVGLAYVLLRRPRAGADTPPDLSMVNRPEPGPRRHVTQAAAISVVLLLMLVAASVLTDRALARMPLKDALNIEVTAHQWWWTVRYRSGEVWQEFETANEIHVPVGRPVVIRLAADDVIHSLWIPNLAGKKDLIPGRTALMQLRADRAGVYRSQCAEFCGFQHALMGLFVIAEPQEQFELWQAAQRLSAPPPADSRTQRGKALVESTACAMCHTVQGTYAQGKRAPDLTHLAGRRTLAAGALPNTPESLASWIADPQRHKPGSNMPTIPISSDDLQAIVAYLETLK